MGYSLVTMSVWDGTRSSPPKWVDCKWVQMGDSGAEELGILAGETVSVDHGKWAKRRGLRGRE